MEDFKDSIDYIEYWKHEDLPQITYHRKDDFYEGLRYSELLLGRVAGVIKHAYEVEGPLSYYDSIYGEKIYESWLNKDPLYISRRV